MWILIIICIYNMIFSNYVVFRGLSIFYLRKPEKQEKKNFVWFNSVKRFQPGPICTYMFKYIIYIFSLHFCMNPAFTKKLFVFSFSLFKSDTMCSNLHVPLDGTTSNIIWARCQKDPSELGIPYFYIQLIVYPKTHTNEHG